jgi:hypothetical protein
MARREPYPRLVAFFASAVVILPQQASRGSTDRRARYFTNSFVFKTRNVVRKTKQRAVVENKSRMEYEEALKIYREAGAERAGDLLALRRRDAQQSGYSGSRPEPTRGGAEGI